VWLHPIEWGTALDQTRAGVRDLSWDRAWYPAWMAAWAEASKANRKQEWIALMAKTRDADWPHLTRSAARCAISALIAYDDCTHMIDSQSSELYVLSKLGSDAATLMLPAAVAFELISQK